MKKLKLDVDTLRVESFAADEAAAALRGTVEGQSFVSDMVPSGCCEPASQYCQETDFHWRTCGNSCVNMCFPTEWEPSCQGC